MAACMHLQPMRLAASSGSIRGSTASAARCHQHHLWPSQRRCLVAAAAAAAEPGDGPTAAAAEPAAEAWHAALPRPATRHQPPLSSKRRAELGAAAEGLARAKTLQRLQVGGKGVTLNTLHAAADALAKHEFLRVKLGEGCGLERRETAAALEQLLDAAVVRQVGFTITLYRQAGLPRPDSLLAKEPPPQQAQEASEQQ